MFLASAWFFFKRFGQRTANMLTKFEKRSIKPSLTPKLFFMRTDIQPGTSERAPEFEQIIALLNTRAGKTLDRVQYHNFVFGYSIEGIRRDDLFSALEVEVILGRRCKNRGRVSDAEYNEAGDLLFGSVNKIAIREALLGFMSSRGYASLEEVDLKEMSELVKSTGFESFKLLYTAFDPSFKKHTRSWRVEDHRVQLNSILTYGSNDVVEAQLEGISAEVRDVVGFSDS